MTFYCTYIKNGCFKTFKKKKLMAIICCFWLLKSLTLVTPSSHGSFWRRHKQLFFPCLFRYIQGKYAKPLWKGRPLFQQRFPGKTGDMWTRGWASSPPKRPSRWERVVDDIEMKKQNVYWKWKSKEAIVSKQSICIRPYHFLLFIKNANLKN